MALKKVLSAGLSVRQTESLVKKSHGKSHVARAKKDPEWNPLVEELQRVLGTKVKIVGRGKRGRIEIEFYSPEELERILDLLRR